MNLQQTPVVFRILNQKNLILDSVLEGDKFLCTDSKGQQFILKECRGVEAKVYQDVFPTIVKMNLNFKVLELPELLDVVTETDPNGQNPQTYVIIKFYNGKSFNKLWNETSGEGYGGRSVEPQFADMIVDVLEDFSKIDEKKLAPFGLLTFDFNNWKTVNFARHLEPSLINANVITKEQFDLILAFISDTNIFKGSKMVLTNGDFYPRNFIELDTGKVVVIDWEGRIDVEFEIDTPEGTQKFTGQRNALLNYLENHLAFIFVHMWGNKKFQKILIKNALGKFELDKNNFRAAVMIKAIEQSYAFGGKALGQRQIEIALDALEGDFVDTLLQ